MCAWFICEFSATSQLLRVAYFVLAEIKTNKCVSTIFINIHSTESSIINMQASRRQRLSKQIRHQNTGVHGNITQQQYADSLRRNELDN